MFSFYKQQSVQSVFIRFPLPFLFGIQREAQKNNYFATLIFIILTAI